jgi:hypothetical protein
MEENTNQTGSINPPSYKVNPDGTIFIPIGDPISVNQTNAPAPKADPLGGLIEGVIVHYVMSESDVMTMESHRQIAAFDGRDFPANVRSNVGNYASPGQHLPMIVVVVWPNEFGPDQPGVNGQLFLDGNDTMWITSARHDESGAPGTWHWIERAK